MLILIRYIVSHVITVAYLNEIEVSGVHLRTEGALTYRLECID